MNTEKHMKTNTDKPMEEETKFCSSCGKELVEVMRGGDEHAVSTGEFICINDSCISKPMEWEKRFDDKFLKYSFCGDRECRYEGIDRCFHSSETSMKRFISQAIQATREETENGLIKKIDSLLETNSQDSSEFVMDRRSWNDILDSLTNKREK